MLVHAFIKRYLDNDKIRLVRRWQSFSSYQTINSYALYSWPSLLSLFANHNVMLSFHLFVRFPFFLFLSSSVSKWFTKLQTKLKYPQTNQNQSTRLNMKISVQTVLFFIILPVLIDLILLVL